MPREIAARFNEIESTKPSTRRRNDRREPTKEVASTSHRDVGAIRHRSQHPSRGHAIDSPLLPLKASFRHRKRSQQHSSLPSYEGIDATTYAVRLPSISPRSNSSNRTGTTTTLKVIDPSLRNGNPSPLPRRVIALDDRISSP